MLVFLPLGRFQEQSEPLDKLEPQGASQSEEGDEDFGRVPGLPGEIIPGFHDLKSSIKSSPEQKANELPTFNDSRKYVAYTVKLPAEQLAALNSIWLELKRLYGAHSPDKSGMIQQAVQDWIKRWDGPDKQKLLLELLEIREDTRKRQYKKQ
jgi:hypothetical protein